MSMTTMTDEAALAVLDSHADDIAHDDLHSGIGRKIDRACEQRAKYRAAVTHLAARIAELDDRATRAEAELARCKETAKHAAEIAHRGGVGGLSEHDALVLIRELTLPHFDLRHQGREARVQAAIDSARGLTPPKG